MTKLKKKIDDSVPDKPDTELSEVPEGEAVEFQWPQTLSELSGADDSVFDKAFAEPVTNYLSEHKEWPLPVEGDMIFEDLYDIYASYLVLKHEQIVALVLWTIHAHCHDAAIHSPILAITSPTMRCGKSTLITILSQLVPNALVTTNTTPAGLFNEIESHKPTVLIDEADTFFNDSAPLRGVLNASFDKHNGQIIRAKRSYRVWAPIAVGFKKGSAVLADTVQDRSIIIELQRKLPDEWVKQLPTTDKGFARVRAMIARWARDNMEALEKSKKGILPKGLNDRAKDCWRPLNRIASLIGEHYLAEAKHASLTLSGGRDETSREELVLAAIHDAFENHAGVDRLPSQVIVDEINENERFGLMEANGGNKLTTVALAHILRPFGIQPKQFRIPGTNKKSQGYRREQFEDAWRRYAAS